MRVYTARPKSNRPSACKKSKPTYRLSPLLGGATSLRPGHRKQRSLHLTRMPLDR